MGTKSQENSNDDFTQAEPSGRPPQPFMSAYYSSVGQEKTN